LEAIGVPSSLISLYGVPKSTGSSGTGLEVGSVVIEDLDTGPDVGI
jgi:hypothetical protein